MNMTPNDPWTEVSTCKSSGTQPENGEAWIARIQALTVKETTSKAHMQVHTNKESCEKQPGKKPGPNWVETGLGRLAWADGPSPFKAQFDAPFDLAASQAIYSPWPRATKKYIRHPPPQDREQETDWIAKGALVAFIYFGGFYTMISATMSNVMG
jgi:hypothetical protein